jgi:hypothetical protein
VTLSLTKDDVASAVAGKAHAACMFTKPAASLPAGWEWFEGPPEPATLGDWNWTARLSSDHTRHCDLTYGGSGVNRSDNGEDALFVASILWQAFVDRGQS